ncbi:MAG: DUF4870 domain-containing protein [Patescibacteria group bacterium]
MDTDQNTTQANTPPPQPQQSGSLSPNVAGALCYSLGAITGVVFLLISQDKTVKFHALQSIFTFLGLFVVSIAVSVVPGIGNLLSPLVSLASLALWILLMVKAYKGEKYKLPVIGDLAEQNVK